MVLLVVTPTKRRTFCCGAWWPAQPVVHGSPDEARESGPVIAAVDFALVMPKLATLVGLIRLYGMLSKRTLCSDAER
jgi:hypothetical protein